MPNAMRSTQLRAIHAACDEAGVPKEDDGKPLSAVERVELLVTRCQAVEGQLERAKHDVEFLRAAVAQM